MLHSRELKKFESELYNKGLSDEVRKKIRTAKICIIDDKIKDLKSFTNDLKREGFNNITECKKSPPVNDLLNDNYDLIILDLNDVATEIAEEDGIGILRMLKEARPYQAILVITGQNVAPEKSNILSKAELVIKKPVKASDLANDITQILRVSRDKYWAAYTVIDELNKIDLSLRSELGLWQRFRLRMTRRSLEKSLQNYDDDIITKMESILRVLKYAVSTAGKIIYVIKQFSPAS